MWLEAESLKHVLAQAPGVWGQTPPVGAAPRQQVPRRFKYFTWEKQYQTSHF